MPGVTTKVDQSIPPQVRRLFVPGVVRFKSGLEGQRVTESGIVELGAACGPIRFDLGSLLHELCHMVEIDDKRVVFYGWGLHVKTCVTIFGRDYYEARTRDCVERECRVLAYQANLQAHVGMRRSVADHVRAMRYVPGYPYVPGKTDDARDRWCAAKIERLRRRSTYSYEAFEREWWRKVAVIKSKQS